MHCQSLLLEVTWSVSVNRSRLRNCCANTDLFFSNVCFHLQAHTHAHVRDSENMPKHCSNHIPRKHTFAPTPPTVLQTFAHPRCPWCVAFSPTAQQPTTTQSVACSLSFLIFSYFWGNRFWFWIFRRLWDRVAPTRLNRGSRRRTTTGTRHDTLAPAMVMVCKPCWLLLHGVWCVQRSVRHSQRNHGS